MINYNMKQKNRTLLVLLLLFQFIGSAQEFGKLTLTACYELAKTNYPAIKKLDLISQTTDFTIQNANKKYLPQVSFSGFATYQSETINFSEAISLPGAAGLFPVISKDQYKIQGEVSQMIYDGGMVRSQKDLATANAKLQKQNVEVNLYSLNNRINSIYFSILLMDAQLAQNELNKANLQTQAQKTEALYKNGTAFKSNVDELKAEILNINMSTIEFEANRKAYLDMLSLFIGKELAPATALVVPETYTFSKEIKRPELQQYDLQKAVYEVQEKQLKVDYLPTFNAFFQGAYGRPTPNIIANEFGSWYVTGIRFNWNLSSLYSLSNQKKLIGINTQNVEVDRETFILNTKLDLSKENEQVAKYTKLIREDEQTILLRQSVSKAAAAQLENGIITTHEYIQKSNAENLAKQTLILHQIQLLQARYNQKFISGN